jgi:uncharacterized membrane protein (UPF0127 family)
MERHLSITNRTRATVVCRQVRIADTFATRLFGLVGKDQLEPGTGLLLQPSTGAHTWGMKFAIDIVTLDKDRQVVGFWENVGPWRMRGLDSRTRSVLELPVGQIALAKIAVGDELAFEVNQPHTERRQNVRPVAFDRRAAVLA